MDRRLWKWAINKDMLIEGAKLVLEVNEKYAKKIGVNVAARTTAIKPEGTASCVLGSSSGIHARHAEYYLRRVRMNKDDDLAVYLKKVVPDLIEDDITSSNGVVVTIPQESPSGAIIRGSETAIDVLNRTVYYNKYWVKPGHRSGNNTHNVSVTINYKDNEVDELRKRLWEDRDHYTGISLLPFDGGNYKQAPFEECTKEVYEKYTSMVKEIDLKDVKEEEDNTNRLQQLACVGGVCEINI
jgi:ribonucleoside-diphosphate reductase alpha chain